MTLTVSTCEIHLLSLHLPSLACKYGNDRLFLAILSRHFSLTWHWWGVALIGVPCLSSGFFVLTVENEKNIYTGPCRLYYVFWIFFLKIIGSQWRILNRGVWCDLWSEVRIVYLSWLSIQVFPRPEEITFFKLPTLHLKTRQCLGSGPLLWGAVSQPCEHHGPGDPILWAAVCGRMPASIPGHTSLDAGSNPSGPTKNAFILSSVLWEEGQNPPIRKLCCMA